MEIYCPVCLGLSRDGRDVSQALTQEVMQQLVSMGRLHPETLNRAPTMAPMYVDSDAEGYQINVHACTNCSYRVGVPRTVQFRCGHCGGVNEQRVRGPSGIQGAPTSSEEVAKTLKGVRVRR